MLLATTTVSATARAQPTEEACEGWLAAFLFLEFREPFWKAAAAETVQACLDAGVDVMARVEDGQTALWHAAGFGGNAEVLEALIAAGADPNTQAGIFRAAPLHLVDTAASVRALVAAGADPDARASSGNTPLHLSQTTLERYGEREGHDPCGAGNRLSRHSLCIHRAKLHARCTCPHSTPF